MTDTEQIGDAPEPRRPFADPDLVVQSWYLAARSEEVRPGRVLSRDMFGRMLALFRDEEGRVRALDARCPHMGADLGQGTLEGGCIRCPFHNWTYGVDGVCVKVPSQEEIPAFARTFAYPTAERFGAIWIFNGPEPLFDLPAFEGWSEARDLLPTVIRPKVLDIHPHIVAMNGLDLQHFQYVHAFQFWEEPVLELPDPHQVTVRMQVKVPPDNLFLRVLRLVAGDRIPARVSTYGGNLALIEAMAGPIPFLMLNTHAPLPGGKSASRTILFSPRLPWWKRLLGLQLILQLVAVAIMMYMLRDDVVTLERLRFRPRMIPPDGPLKAFLRQVNRMPTFDPDVDWSPTRTQAKASAEESPQAASETPA